MSNTNEPWTKEEDNALLTLYPHAPQTEIMQAIPRFSWYRICDRAKVYKLPRNITYHGRFPVNIYHRTVSYQDLEAVAKRVDEPEEKERMQEIANELARGTLRGELSAHWWLPLDDISYVSDFDILGKDYPNDGSIPDGLHHPAL